MWPWEICVYVSDFPKRSTFKCSHEQLLQKYTAFGERSRGSGPHASPRTPAPPATRPALPRGGPGHWPLPTQAPPRPGPPSPEPLRKRRAARCWGPGSKALRTAPPAVTRSLAPNPTTPGFVQLFWGRWVMDDERAARHSAVPQPEPKAPFFAAEELTLGETQSREDLETRNGTSIYEGVGSIAGLAQEDPAADIGCRCGSDPALLCRRPAATAPIRPLAWKLSFALGPKKKKKKVQDMNKRRRLFTIFCLGSPSPAPLWVQKATDLDAHRLGVQAAQVSPKPHLQRPTQSGPPFQKHWLNLSPSFHKGQIDSDLSKVAEPRHS